MNSSETDYQRLQSQLEKIADQICRAVDGKFDFVVSLEEEDEVVQKLSMLINFLLDSARRSVEEEKKQQQVLKELDQLKSDFMANISHEIRTPLTLILSPLEAVLLDEKYSLSPDQRKEVKRMYRNAFRLHTLVNNLLDFAKLDARRFELDAEDIQVIDVMSSLVDDMQPLAYKKNILLTMDTKLSKFTQWLDYNLLERIVINLLNNALKFTPSGGNITLTLKKSSDALIISVRDTGIGIPSDETVTIFDRFHQIHGKIATKNAGTGLGLSLVKEFTELMNGSVSVESVVNKGSTFTVTLPITVEKKSNKKTQLADDDMTNLSTYKDLMLHEANFPSPNSPSSSPISPLQIDSTKPVIVLADDNDDLREYISEYLQKDYHVIAVENGKLALDAVRNNKVATLISDVMMPELDGIGLVKILKADEQLKHIPVILVTAQAGSDSIVESINVGADDYLTKPFQLMELKARVKSTVRLNNAYSSLQIKTKDLETAITKLESLNQKMIKISREAGMSEVASGILHNVGNVLNSINVSAIIISDSLSNNNFSQRLQKATDILIANLDNIDNFFNQDESGKKFPEYLMLLAENSRVAQNNTEQEVGELLSNLTHVKTIIATQQSHVKNAAILEIININDLLTDVIKLQKNSLNMEGIQVKFLFDRLLPDISIDKHKFLTIIMNLISNATHALKHSEINSNLKEITIQTSMKNNNFIDVALIDNGIGIAKENLDKLFTQGFSTKSDGTGFGLHSSSLVAQDMGGFLTANSDGLGMGASFIVSLPINTLTESNCEKK